MSSFNREQPSFLPRRGKKGTGQVEQQNSGSLSSLVAFKFDFHVITENQIRNEDSKI